MSQHTFFLFQTYKRRIPLTEKLFTVQYCIEVYR